MPQQDLVVRQVSDSVENLVLFTPEEHVQNRSYNGVVARWPAFSAVSRACGLRVVAESLRRRPPVMQTA